jgi:PKD repeat protein
MKTILFIILIINSLFVAGQGQLISVSGSYKSHKDQSGTYSFYYFTGNEDGSVSSGNITFNLANFNNGDIIHLDLEEIVDANIIIQTANLSVNNNQVSVPISTLGSGIYRIKLVDNNGTSTRSNIFLLIENIETFDFTGDATIQNMPLKFYTHYNNDYFPNSLGSSFATIKGYVKEGWKKSWIKENNEWALCQGLPNNTIIDKDNKFDIYLFDHTKIQTRVSNSYYYHAIIQNGKVVYHASTSLVVDEDGLMYINSDINSSSAPQINSLLNTSLTDESTFLTEVISHEMLHGIQNSWVPFVPTTKVDHAKRKWQREGQARFLETVLMGETNFQYNGKNTAMLNNSLQGGSLYESDTKIYLDSIIQIKIPPKLEHVSYRYAIFWRHLFEHNFSPSTPVANRLILLRETMKTNTTALLTDIKQKMDVALSNANGNFLSFEDAIKDFTKRVYFFHKDWKDASGNKLNNWEDPNNCSFYETLGSGISDHVINIDAASLSCFSGNFELKSSYGFVPHSFKFFYPGKFTLRFNSDPDGDTKMARFYVKAFLIDDKTIKLEKECILTNGLGSMDFEITKEEQPLTIIVTRLDLDEGNNNNYSIDISPTEQLKADFQATPAKGNEYYKISFKSTSKGVPPQCIWDVGTGVTVSNLSISPTYKKSGSYNVTLTVSNCKGSDSKTINNYVNLLPPFLEKIEIVGDGSTFTSSLFSRTYDNITGTYSCNNSPQQIEGGKDLVIKVRSTAPLQKLILQILRSDNKDASGYVDEQTSTSTNQRDWEFHVPKSGISKGFSNVWFTGTDYSGKDLLKDAVPIDRAVVISTTGYISPDLTLITGTDKNYFIYIKPLLGSTNMDIVVDKTDCATKLTTIFVYSNYDKGLCNIDFGDGATIPILPNNMLKHTYNTSTTKTFTIKMIKDGSVISSKTMKF